MANNKPAATLRDGRLKATIWRNRADGRTFHSVQLSRTYKDADGSYRDSDRFSRAELLQLAHLAQRAYDELGRLARSDDATADDGRVT